QRDAVTAEVTDCLQRLDALAATCSKVFPADEVPSVDKLREMLELLQQELQQPGEAGASAAPAGDDARAAAGPRPAAVAGAIQSREDVVRTLQSVVRYLRQTEPHSPVSYMLERCTRWLSMGFDELMQDLVKDPGIVEALREKLGIAPPPQP